MGSIIVHYLNFRSGTSFIIRIRRSDPLDFDVIETYVATESKSPFVGNCLLATIRDDFSFTVPD